MQNEAHIMWAFCLRKGEVMLVKEGLPLEGCGIYAINNILSGKVYVGSSVRMNRRYKDHSGALFKNKHTNKQLQPQRLAKFSRMIIKIMDEVYALVEGVYTLHYVNYIAGEGRYDLWEYEPKKPCKNRAVKTDQIYDRFIELIYEDLNYTELGRRCIEGMDKQGIELRKYDAEKIEDLYGE